MHQSKAAKEFNSLSDSEIKRLYRKLGGQPQLAKRFGLTRNNVSIILRKRGLNRAPVCTLDHKTGRGRLFELHYSSIRGSSIIKDANLENCHGPYDFIDKDFGKVDVKGATLHLARRYNGNHHLRWTINLKAPFPQRVYDVVIGLLYDQAITKLERVCVIPVQDTVRWKSSACVTQGGDIWHRYTHPPQYLLSPDGSLQLPSISQTP